MHLEVIILFLIAPAIHFHGMLPDNDPVFAACNSRISETVPASAQGIKPATVSPPTLAASDTLLCASRGLTLTAGNFPAGSALTWFRDNEPVQTDTASGTSLRFFVPAPAGGKYSVRLNDALHPVFSNVVQVLVEPAVVPEIYQSGDTLYSVLPCLECQWLQNNQPVPGATHQSFVPQNSGAYQLDYSSAKGCVYHSKPVQVTISEPALPPDIKQFSLKPDPVTGMLTLDMQLEKPEHFTISLLDTSRRQLFFQTRQQEHLVLPIDLSGAPSGAYFLDIQLESGSYSRKILKQ